MYILKFLLIGVFLNLFATGISQNGLQETNTSFSPVKNTLSVGFSPERLARIDTFLNQAITDSILPHALTFVARHGKIVHYKAFGYKNLEQKIPLQKTDIFRNASQTKAIVSVGLMMLYEQGRFLLDEPVSRYIPEFKNMQVLDSLVLKDTSWLSHPVKNDVTIRQLLNHTSGITYGNPYYSKYKIPLLNSTEPITIGQVVKQLTKLPLKFEPGTRFNYGYNTDVIGYLIEVLSGNSLDQYLQKNIFEPLGMTDTYFYLPDSKASRLVTLYEKARQKSKMEVTRSKQNQIYPVSGARTYFGGGAGLVGTIEDYARFCQMLLNGGTFNNKRIISRKTVDLMTMNQIGDLTINKEGDKFGLGFQIFTPQGGLSRSLSSEGAYRWGGMYGTDYVIDPKEDLILLFYTNIQPYYQHSELQEKFRNLVYQALE